jgi:hypothetical protein
VQGYDFDRMVVEFTMLNQGNVIRCVICAHRAIATSYSD